MCARIDEQARGAMLICRCAEQLIEPARPELAFHARLLVPFVLSLLSCGCLIRALSALKTQRMDMDAATNGSVNQGATVVVTHRVREGKHADYEAWLGEIAPLCKASPGHLDWHIVRPIAGLTETYTVVIRFDTTAHLKQWMESPARARLIEKVRPLFVTGDDFFVSSGLDFWFTPGGAKAMVPVRWKQYLVTWSAIYPLVLGVPLVVRPLLRSLGAPDNYLLTTLIVTGTVVFLMVYVVMPRYTKLIKRWLFT
jgi:antibiotic biosynthesis monooxygenase (ABM) superfamily enzyme